jgi:LmbE family N-acetylglucosaminyl deacetylase
MPLPEDEIERILVVTAHPDDVDFGVAGSVAVWTDRGVEVSYCIVTDGDAGGFDPDVPRSEIAGIRRAEQTAAAEQVGVTDVTFLGHPDGRLYPTIELRRDISRVIRRVRPQRVLTQSPERNYKRMYASHPDHMAAGEATLCAVYPDARNPFAHPELLEEGYDAWTVPEVWIMSSEAGDTFTDITSAIDRKIKALLCHVSQMTNPDGIDKLIRGWASANAVAAKLPEGSYAESFQLIPTA